MGERDQPNIDEVREALREHDERVRLNEEAEHAGHEEEPPPDEPDEESRD